MIVDGDPRQRRDRSGRHGQADGRAQAAPGRQGRHGRGLGDREAPPRQQLIAPRRASRGILFVRWPASRRFHRRPARAHRHRRGDRRARAAQAPGQGIRVALPFHDERSASFTVSPTKQFYRCFRLRRTRHRDLLPDELRPPRVPRRGRRTRQARRHGSAARHAPAQRRRRHARVVRRARCCCKFFRKHLASDKAKAYVERREIAPEIAERYASATRPTASTPARRARHRCAACSCSSAPACSRRTTRATSTTSSATA